MGRWIRFLLNEGELDGVRLLSRDTMRETMSPQMIIGSIGSADEIVFPDATFITYGMGWFISDYRGRKVLSHTGGIDGMASFVALMPSEGLGVAILENLEHDLARFAIRNLVFDRYLGQRGEDWLARQADWTSASRETDGQGQQKEQAEPGDTTAFDDKGYSGRYANALYGSADVRLSDDGFPYLRIGDLPEVRLVHREGHTFELSWPDVALNVAGPSSLNFHPAADGGPRRFVLAGPILDADVVYTAFNE